jgi:hypothetical protein
MGRPESERSIKGETKGIDAPGEDVLAAGGGVARIFSRDHSGHKPSGLKRGTIHPCIPVISSESLGTLSPLRRISVRASAGRVRHADSRAEGGPSEGAGFE